MRRALRILRFNEVLTGMPRLLTSVPPSSPASTQLLPGKGMVGRRTLLKGLMLASAAPLLAACQSEYFPKHLAPLPAALQVKMERLGVSQAEPIFMRIFKEEGELEIWKQGRDGRYILLESYEICTWSGELGPKFAEGDRQAPEGFYTITPAQMNPNSNFYLSFNLGFPNAFDRSHGRTGSHLMVHGACSSAGCYAMTDEQIAEIYALAREAFEGGQRAFQVHAFPFRMSAQNMAEHARHRHFAFWQMLQEGYQYFEVTRIPPQVDVCDRRYIFNAQSAQQFSAAQECPSYTVPDNLRRPFEVAQAEHQRAFEVAMAQIDAQNAVPIVTTDPVSGNPVAVAQAMPAPAPAAGPASVPLPAGEQAVAAAAEGGVQSPIIPPNAPRVEQAFAQAQRNPGLLERTGAIFGGLFSGN